MPWQYLPDFGEVHDWPSEIIVLKLAPEKNWHDLPDDERAWWDTLGELLAQCGRTKPAIPNTTQD